MNKKNTHQGDAFLQHLGDAIRCRRINLLLSQEQLGLRAGLHRTYVTDIENGSRNMSLMTLRRVTGALSSLMSEPIIEAEKALRVDENRA